MLKSFSNTSTKIPFMTPINSLYVKFEIFGHELLVGKLLPG